MGRQAKEKTLKRASDIVSIGQGLCRLTVRSVKQRDLYAKIPGVRIDDREAEYLGYRVLFPERLRGLIQSTLDQERERAEKPPQGAQMKLTLPEKKKGGDRKTRQKAEGRRQKAVGSRQKAEGSRQKGRSKSTQRRVNEDTDRRR